jgi:hypothetical protein
MTDIQGWARVWPAAKIDGKPLRRGAWYRIVSAGRSKVVLEVRNTRYALPHDAVEVRRTRPDRFTVVYRPLNAPNPHEGTKKDLGRMYAVCPESGTRIKLFGRPDELLCPVCGHRGEIAWWETG